MGKFLTILVISFVIVIFTQTENPPDTTNVRMRALIKQRSLKIDSLTRVNDEYIERLDSLLKTKDK